MIAVAGGIIIVGLVVLAFGIGGAIFNGGMESGSNGAMGCGCAIMLAVVAGVIFVIL